MYVLYSAHLICPFLISFMESSNVIPTFELGWNPVMWHFNSLRQYIHIILLVFQHFAQWNWEISVEFNLATSEVERTGHDWSPLSIIVKVFLLLLLFLFIYLFIFFIFIIVKVGQPGKHQPLDHKPKYYYSKPRFTALRNYSNGTRILTKL